MTFSDSRVSKMLSNEFVPAWQSVSPVRVVTFDLGDGRSLKGTVNGEIAIYFCDSSGKVFDILPALQSPAVTLNAMKEAHSFYKKHNGKISEDLVKAYHLERMEKVAGQRYDKLRKEGHPIFGNRNNVLTRDHTDLLFTKSKQGEDKRDKYIEASVDDATSDLRRMSMSKVMIVPSRTAAGIAGEAMIVVEPGGLGYYQWQIDRAFLGGVSTELNNSTLFPKDAFPVSDSPNSLDIWPNRSWTSSLKTPTQWKNLLFIGIFKQELKGGNVKYNSESLEAISIIEE